MSLMANVNCSECRQSVPDFTVEDGLCFGCAKLRKAAMEYRRQALIDGSQTVRRTGAVQRGEARRFMGRFSSTLKRSR